MAIENTLYSDLDLSLYVPPQSDKDNDVDRDIKILKNAAAVKRSLKHLFFIEQYDVPFDSTMQSSLKALLFEPVSRVIAANIQSSIEFIVKMHEPRVTVLRTDVNINSSGDGYDIELYFSIKSLNRDENLTLLLKRAR